MDQVAYVHIQVQGSMDLLVPTLKDNKSDNIWWKYRVATLRQWYGMPAPFSAAQCFAGHPGPFSLQCRPSTRSPWAPGSVENTSQSGASRYHGPCATPRAASRTPCGSARTSHRPRVRPVPAAGAKESVGTRKYTQVLFYTKWSWGNNRYRLALILSVLGMANKTSNCVVSLLLCFRASRSPDITQ